MKLRVYFFYSPFARIRKLEQKTSLKMMFCLIIGNNNAFLRYIFPPKILVTWLVYMGEIK